MEPLDMIALYVVATWLLERGFSLSPTWDYTAPECVRDYGPYRIWTIQGNVSPEMAEHLDLSALKDDLREYLEKHSALHDAAASGKRDKTQCHIGQASGLGGYKHK